MATSSKLSKELEGMAYTLSKMPGHHVRRAMLNAMNTTFTAARQQIVVKTAKKEQIPQQVVRNKIRFNKKKGDHATFNRLKAQLHVYHVNVPLLSLIRHQGRINQTKITAISKSRVKKRDYLAGLGITVGGKGNRNRFYRRSFLGRNTKGTAQIFQRHGKERYDLRVPKVDIATFMKSIDDFEVKKASNTIFEKALKREYEQRLKGVIK